MTERINKLKEATQTMHRCAAHHVAFEPVIELFNNETQYVVLELAPVDSAEAAVKIAIAAKAKGFAT